MFLCCASLDNMLDLITYHFAEIGFSVFFGVGVGAVLGTAIVLIVVCIMKGIRRSIKQKERRCSLRSECIPDSIQKYKKLLDDGAITEDEYKKIKKQFLNQ